MKWDVFISHAYEDKEAIARPLAKALEARGLRVWFDEFTLSVGDSLRRSIDHGLANSRFGIVILSPRFFAKDWPQRELDGLVTRETHGVKVILPVWHDLNSSEISNYSPILADRLAVSVRDGLERVVAELLRAIQRDTPDDPVSTTGWVAPQTPQTSPSKAETTGAVASDLIPKIDSLASDLLKRAVRGEKRVLEIAWREKSGLARPNIKLLYKSLVRECNSLIDTYLKESDALISKLRVALSKRDTLEIVEGNSETRARNYRAHSFLVIRKATKLLPDRIRGDDVLDSEIIRADKDLEETIEKLKCAEFITPGATCGFSTVKENGTYPPHWGPMAKQEMIRNAKSEVTENPGFQLLKKLFGDQHGDFRIIEFAVQQSRERKHVIVNPSACYWSGEIDYDEVVYQHYFRWCLRVTVLSQDAPRDLVSSFRIESLALKPDPEI